MTKAKMPKNPVQKAAEFNFDEMYSELQGLQGAQNKDKDAIRKLQEAIIAAHQAAMRTAFAEKDYDKYRHHSDQVKNITRTGQYMKETAWRGVSSAGHLVLKGAETLGKGIVAPLVYMGRGWMSLSTTSKIVSATIGLSALGIGFGFAFPALAFVAPYVVVGAIGLALTAGILVGAWKVVSAVCRVLKPVGEALLSVAKATWGVLSAIGRGLISAFKFGLDLCRAIKYDVMAEYDRQKPGIDGALERMEEFAFKEKVPASVSTKGGGAFFKGTAPKVEKEDVTPDNSPKSAESTRFEGSDVTTVTYRGGGAPVSDGNTVFTPSSTKAMDTEFVSNENVQFQRQEEAKGKSIYEPEKNVNQANKERMQQITEEIDQLTSQRNLHDENMMLKYDDSNIQDAEFMKDGAKLDDMDSRIAELTEEHTLRGERDALSRFAQSEGDYKPAVDRLAEIDKQLSVIGKEQPSSNKEPVQVQKFPDSQMEASREITAKYKEALKPEQPEAVAKSDDEAEPTHPRQG